MFLSDQLNSDEFESSFHKKKSAIEAKYIGLGQPDSSAYKKALYAALLDTFKEFLKELVSSLDIETNRSSYCELGALKGKFISSFEILLRRLESVFYQETSLNKFSEEFKNYHDKIKCCINNKLNLTIQKKKNNMRGKFIVWLTTSFVGALAYNVIDKLISHIHTALAWFPQIF